MREELLTKIEELRKQLVDISTENARISALESELNKAINIRNEKLYMNNDINAKIQKITEVMVMFEEPITEGESNETNI